MRMTKSQVESLKFGIEPVDDRTILLIESGLNWINENTTLNIDCTSDEQLRSLSANVKLFLMTYCDIMTMPIGISSESIEGLSQSFDTSKSRSDLLLQYAKELLGGVMKSQMSFAVAKKRWF